MKIKSFEDSVKELEDLIEDLEKGDIPLEEAIKKFEAGISLIKYCNKKLDEAERKIEIVLKDDNEVKTAPFHEKDQQD
jgi:exodeoxyribonuclease VII small subunit